MQIRFPATALIFLMALWLKALYPSASGIADTDFYWHIAYGRWMLEHGQIPAGDVFSWTMPGETYRLTQWLGELAMGLAYNLGELWGTRTLSILLTGGTIWFAWRAAARFVHTNAALAIALMCNLVQVILPMRPQLFSFFLIAIVSYLLASWIATRRRVWLWLYPPIMALWVNLHGGYIIGLVLLGVFLTGRCIEAWLQKRLMEARGELLLLAGILCVATLATLLNPYGIWAWLNVVMISGLQSSKVISEWMPVNLLSDVGWFYLINLIPFVGLMQVSRGRPSLTYGLMAGVFFFFGLSANRQVPMMAAMMAPIFAFTLSRAEQYVQWLPRFRNPNRPALYGAVAVVLVLVAIPVMQFGQRSVDRNINATYPVEAVRFMEKHGLTKRVMSDTLEASYLIFKGIPVFVDGRMDLYRDKFYFEWYRAYKGEPGWEAVIEKWKPDAMLLRNDMAIRQLVLATGKWSVVFDDGRYSVITYDK